MPTTPDHAPIVAELRAMAARAATANRAGSARLAALIMGCEAELARDADPLPAPVMLGIIPEVAASMAGHAVLDAHEAGDTREMIEALGNLALVLGRS